MNGEVHIVGNGFTGATEVQFNGVPATSFNVLSDTEIATLVPEGARFFRPDLCEQFRREAATRYLPAYEGFDNVPLRAAVGR